MEYRLNEPEPGVFEIVQSMPVVVGRFTDRALAQKVRDFLELDARDGQAPAGTVPAEQAGPGKVHRRPQALPSKQPSHGDWTEGEIGKAFELLHGGESLKSVAARYGKSWTALRGRWAAHRRANPAPGTALVPAVPPAGTPLEKVAAAVKELGAQESCQACGRYFKPTPDQLDLCARCYHGA
ncbi:hypothetical protein ACUXV3_12405 [Roseobacteraceae bacterium NS-SX3]